MTLVQGGKSSRIVASRHRHLIRVLVFILFAVIFVSLSLQLVSLHSRYRSYKAREASVQQQIKEQKEKQQDLRDYEKYTKTKEYTEGTARSKLGLLYDNETIFKEK